MSVRVRIAPSPTGNLHIGTARTAIYNWLFARHHGGKLVLRIEDTDRERSEERFTRSIREGFAWLGLDFDEGPIFQSDRMSRYREVVEQLLATGHAYRCYTSEAELDALRTQQRAAGQAPRYDNRHRTLTPEQEAAFIAEGRTPVIRFKIEEPREVRWPDLVRGDLVWNTSDLGGDMVIARADGTPLYNLAVVIDDWDMAISHVIRGEDHIGNTPKQILLYEALGAKVPEFGHVPLIFSPEGRKLSKREGATAVVDFERMGYLSEAMVNYLALMSWTPEDGRELFTLTEAAASFDIGRVSRSPARFDWDKLTWMNGQYMAALGVPELAERMLPFVQAAGLSVQPWERPWFEKVVALTGRGLARLNEIAPACRYLFEDSVAYKPEALAVLRGEIVPNLLTSFDRAVAHLNDELRENFSKRLADLVPEIAEPVALFADALHERKPLRALLPREASPEQLAALAALVTELHELAATRLAQLPAAVAKELGVKKGAVMKPLRCALTGEEHGPDLTESLVLLHRRGKVRSRLAAALQLVSG